MGFMEEVEKEWNKFKTDIEKMEIPRDKKGPVAIVFIATLFFGWLFEPLAWLIGAAGIYYAADAFVKLRKHRNSDADPEGLIGFGVSNDRYALAGIAVLFFIACAIVGTVLVPALAAAISFYVILKFTASIRGQDHRRRNPFADW